MKKLVAVAGLVTFLAVTGCATEQEPQDEVASLETTSRAAPGAPSSASVEESRPRLRLDMTPEETDELYRVYSQCLADNGFDKQNIPPGTVPDVDTEKRAAAACVSKDPLPPWEYDVANPEAEDFMHQLVQCLRGKGVNAQIVPPQAGEERWSVSFPGGPEDSESVGNALDANAECERELAR